MCDAWAVFDWAANQYGHIQIESADRPDVCVEIWTDKGQPSYYYQVAETYDPVALALCKTALKAKLCPMDDRANS